MNKKFKMRSPPKKPEPRKQTFSMPMGSDISFEQLCGDFASTIKNWRRKGYGYLTADFIMSRPQLLSFQAGSDYDGTYTEVCLVVDQSDAECQAELDSYYARKATYDRWAEKNKENIAKYQAEQAKKVHQEEVRRQKTTRETKLRQKQQLEKELAELQKKLKELTTEPDSSAELTALYDR
jgi:hypothetical protein